MRLSRYLIWTVMLVLLLSSAVGFAQSREVADLVLHNATIYTMDAENPVASAIAIKGDRILAVGTRSDVAKLTGKGTEVVNLKQATVLPGLIDSHVHFQSIGTRELLVDCYWKPKAEILDAIAVAVAGAASVDEWIRGAGFNEAVWDPPISPNKDDLDPVSPDNPVYITRYCGHQAWVNSRALEIAGITKDTPDPDQGTIVREADGEPTGLLMGTARGLVSQHIPSEWTPEQLKRATILADERLASVGLTSVHDAGSGLSTINLMKELYEEGLIKVRVYQMARYRDVMTHFDEPKIGLFGDRYTIRSVKFGADGALGARSAAMLEPYTDRHDYSGLLYVEEDELAGQISDLLAIGFQSRVHAIGDRGNRVTLNAFEKALQQVPVNDHRLAIEHAQILHLDDIPRFAELGVVASMQPLHATEDMLFAEDRVGPERILGGYAWRSLLDLGVVIAGGSDAPVSPPNPIWGIHAAVTRQDRNNNPPGGWYPEQSVTREEALKMFTLDAAYAAFEEDIKGSLEQGKLADLVVIDRDIMDGSMVAADDIWKAEVLMTMIGGEFVYEKQ